MAEPKGYLSLVLHAHLPFVRHPEYPDFMEEDWLFEAITETYIPLLDMFGSLVRDGVDFRMTMSMTPPLLSMLGDDLLRERYVAHLDNLLTLMDKERDRCRTDPVFEPLAAFYADRLSHTRSVFADQLHGDLTSGFRQYQDMGKLEIITSGATHGFLPLMSTLEGVRAQIDVAVETHRKYLRRAPRGIWLPECGYAEGLEKVLAEYGIRYFFMDTHGILLARPRPKYGVFSSAFTPSGVAVFGRDVESSKQVWSSKEGYPGDADYREFYRDVGFDLPMDYIRPHLGGAGIRKNLGIKYYRITGQTDRKEPYSPRRAREKAALHAGNFMFNREKQVEYLAGIMDRQPIVVSPYDAELFGHWWFEGPWFLEYLFRKLHYDQETVKPITPSEYLARYPRNQVIRPSPSTWGYKGYYEVWLDGSNEWIYRHLHQAEARMVELARDHRDAYGLKERALNQAARELLLAQSSDWAFIMKTGTTVPYAVRRTREHVQRFNTLYDQIRSGQIDEGYLRELEWRDNIFPHVDFRVYTPA